MLRTNGEDDVINKQLCRRTGWEVYKDKRLSMVFIRSALEGCMLKVYRNLISIMLNDFMHKAKMAIARHLNKNLHQITN